MNKPLRIGLLIRGTAVPAWYYETISAIRTKGYAIFFILLPDEPVTEKESFSYRLFKKFEDAWFRSSYDANKSVSLASLVTESNSLRLTHQNNQTSAQEQQTIKALSLDVVYSASYRIQNSEAISELAAFGLWYVRFGYGRYALERPTAFWEVMDNVPVTGSYLLVKKSGRTLIAYEGTTLTVPYSVKNNFNSVAWKAAAYLGFRLATLEKEGASFLDRLLTLQLPTGKQRHPNNINMPALFLKNIAGYLKYKINRKREGRYTIHYAHSTFKLDTLSSQKFTSLPLPNKDVFFADPFVIERGGKQHIFFEEMVYAKGRAHLSVVTLENGTVSAPKVILQRPYHLSYPFVFEHDGTFYMIPETSENKTVELYRAVAFPDKWKFVMNLMENVMVLDATLHFNEGKWWLFGNGFTHSFVSTNDQLFLYYSDALLSTDWKPHPRNPVATHAKNCRPAGRIFRHDNKLYRPAQNNASQQYGYGLKINKIITLTEDDYEEKEVLSLKPETFGLKACHHLDFSASVIVIDGIKA